MVHVTLITVGTLKEDYLRRAAEEYKKRLGTLARVEEIELSEVRIPDEDDATAVRSALLAEGERILARIPEGAYTVALCVEGKQMPSEALAKTLSDGAAQRGKLCVIIGSSHGLAPTVKQRADLRLSVSALTFPHQLMRVLLLEVIYRCFGILKGTKYHK